MNLQFAPETAIGAEALSAPKPQLAVPQRTRLARSTTTRATSCAVIGDGRLLDQNDER
jgi:hypothetical protein